MRNPCPDSVTFVTSTLTPVMKAGTDAAGDMAVAVATKTKQHITLMDSARSSRLFFIDSQQREQKRDGNGGRFQVRACRMSSYGS